MKISFNMYSTGPINNIRHEKGVSSSGSGRPAAQQGTVQPSANAALSSPAELMMRASSRLHGDQNVRTDVVEAAREKLKQWDGLSDQQIDFIADDLVADFG